MKMHIEFNSVSEWMAFLASIRNEPIDPEQVARLTALLGTSTDALTKAVDDVPK